MNKRSCAVGSEGKQKYVVVQSKRTGKKFLAKEAYARKMQSENKVRITAKEGERGFDKEKKVSLDKEKT